jgi:class 3 adenylate cyclase
MSTDTEQHEVLSALREYLVSAGGPDSHLNPGWLARRLAVEERELLGALAYAVRDGLVELHWEVYCPGCGLGIEELDSLTRARSLAECVPCELHFELHLDRDVRVTFSASERVRRERGATAVSMSEEPVRLEDESVPPTRGLDLLLVPAFRELFSGEAPAADESLRIGRVAILFTDLRGSTAMYAERGDPLAYRLVRDHFAILAEAIERNRGAFIKTIGDAVMASFASGADAVRAAFESQTELHARAEAMGGELIIKAGVHAGACLSVRLNERLDFFGGAVNTAARVQGLSHGNDVVITDAVLADLQDEAATAPTQFQLVESFDAELRGLPAPIRIHRLRQ